MTETQARTEPRNALDELPGELLMWVLIVSELLVFGAGLAAFLGVRISDPSGFAEAQDHLHRTGAALNTVVLITSGFLAARAVHLRRNGQRAVARRHLIAAMLLGGIFLWIKGGEFAEKVAQGIGVETHPFFMFYYLLTGFHAAHVAAGIVILGLVAIWDEAHTIEVGAAFWHMVDLVWVLLFPVIYLLA
ncbi:cytochrome c oxidase subunit 3 [Aliiruegeria sabulilitoris]|uniref:cytochrome c oxidase subunit 3 n=1 Tax=Aliiruegeria sabulilitoris TaxID=1510458 RepID=UPI00082EA0B8|nr:cytochrome c oxidase subunit 3 [Aliiruegeria sabulilitoris]